jgi:hypothetical protein
VIIVSHTERAPKGGASNRNPRAWKGLLLYPGFGEPVSRSQVPELSFALPMLVDPGGPALKGTLKLVAGGKTVAELPFALGEPDKDGRLVALGRIPIAPLPPGGYDLEVTVTAGERREVRSAEFSVIK